MNSESEKGWITRRTLLMATPAIMATPSILMAPFQAMAQTGKALVATRTLNNVMISVSDMTRSVEFYQKLFGTPVMQGDVAVFRVGEGPGFFALTAVKNGAKPDFLSYGLTVENFDPNGLMKILTDNAVQGAVVTTRDGTPEVWAARSRWHQDSASAHGLWLRIGSPRRHSPASTEDDGKAGVPIEDDQPRHAHRDGWAAYFRLLSEALQSSRSVEARADTMVFRGRPRARYHRVQHRGP